MFELLGDLTAVLSKAGLHLASKLYTLSEALSAPDEPGISVHLPGIDRLLDALVEPEDEEDEDYEEPESIGFKL